MEKVIVYLDDPAYARQRMPGGDGAPTHWLLVACAPRMTHRISKWVSHSARENWRAKWADRLFEQVIPQLQARGDTVTPILARGPLPELTRTLMAEHGETRVLDVRRPKQDQPGQGGNWASGTMMSLGALFLLAFD
ncbi:hypothetical protein H8N03_07585 [Ramlibacter sp. USB13]|uniref:Uncharacterized protein n=1 Tax=Ramlibacter cellulosilyticus TaxID=2764187 RepID=A0A923MQN3_9BURK|nr:hypothetical protein [Ramlibacter cellulosilyticus]MBC5782804.1 hypothetical protein [Ramlibacter cellulosilyticus]